MHVQLLVQGTTYQFLLCRHIECLSVHCSRVCNHFNVVKSGQLTVSCNPEEGGCDHVIATTN